MHRGKCSSGIELSGRVNGEKAHILWALRAVDRQWALELNQNWDRMSTHAEGGIGRFSLSVIFCSSEIPVGVGVYVYMLKTAGEEVTLHFLAESAYLLCF